MPFLQQCFSGLHQGLWNASFWTFCLKEFLEDNQRTGSVQSASASTLGVCWCVVRGAWHQRSCGHQPWCWISSVLLAEEVQILTRMWNQILKRVQKKNKMGSRWSTQNEVCTMQNLQYLTIYSWCCSRSILACHHLWGSSKSQSSQSFHSTSAEIQRFAAPSKTLEIKIPTEQPFDLTSQGLTVWLESMSLSGWVRDWRLGIHCSVPRPRGKVFMFFLPRVGQLVFYGSDFRDLKALAHWHWDANELSDESDEGFVMSLNSAWTLPSPFLKRLRRHRKSCWRYPKTFDIQCEISYIQWIKWIKWIKKQPRWITNHWQSHRENVVWHLDRSTEVATHWELLVLLEGSGRLKMDENYDKSKKQNQSVDSKVSVYIMKIMNHQFEHFFRIQSCLIICGLC